MRLIRPEDASPALRDLYEAIRFGLRAAYVPDVFLTLGEHPRYLEELWSTLETVVTSEEFRDECEHVRRTAEEAAGNLPLPKAEEIGEILASPLDHAIPVELEAIMETESRASVVASVLHASLRGEGDGPMIALTPSGEGPPPAHLRLIEEESASDHVKAICSDVENVLGGAFLPSGYRALAKWPHFLETGWRHLKTLLGGSAYDLAREQVLEAAFFGGRPFFSARLFGESLVRSIGLSEAEGSEIRSHARLFSRFEPGLVVESVILFDIAGSIMSLEREEQGREAETERERAEAA